MRHLNRNILVIVLLAGLCFAAGGCANGSSGRPAPFGLTGQDKPANFTIVLALFASPDHSQEAELARGELVRTTGWDDLFVYTDQSKSELRYGTYATRSQAEGDLKKIRTYRAGEVCPFARALVMPLEAREIGPPQYNLVNSEGAFTVLVAEFYDEPEYGYVGREQFAVDYCRQLRQRGFPAYYYHGARKSLVTIGSFPESSYPQVVDSGVTRRVLSDPAISEILRQFPDLAVNGREEILLVPSNSGGKAKLKTATSIMVIPRD